MLDIRASPRDMREAAVAMHHEWTRGGPVRHRRGARDATELGHLEATRPRAADHRARSTGAAGEKREAVASRSFLQGSRSPFSWSRLTANINSCVKSLKLLMSEAACFL
jgi:hypothetical protein